MTGTYPDSQVPRARSARQQFWLDHLRAWQAQGKRCELPTFLSLM